MTPSRNFGLIGLSAILLSISFCFPSWAAPCVFIFLIPLSFCSFNYEISFLHGLWWGILFWGTHLAGFVQLMHERGHGHTRVVVAVIFILFLTLHAGIWFFSANLIGRLTRCLYKKSIAWMLSTAAYFYWIEYFALWPFGIGGYTAGAPLLPLAEYPILLIPASLFGPSIYFWCIIVCSVALAHALKKLKKVNSKSIIIGFSCYIFLVAILIWGKSHQFIETPFYIDLLGYAQPPASNLDAQEQAEEIDSILKKLLLTHPQIKIICMPESTFTRPLNQNQFALEIWQENSLKNHDLIILLGSPRKNSKYEYNSLYKIDKCRITFSYDKSTPMPFTEYIPNHLKEIKCIKELFLKNKKEFSPKENCGAICELLPNVTVTPKLCSDFFLDTSPQQSKNPIFFAVNDSWFSARYMRHLMFLFAVYRAIILQNEIIYISHTKGCWITKSGKFINLAS